MLPCVTVAGVTTCWVTEQGGRDPEIFVMSALEIEAKLLTVRDFTGQTVFSMQHTPFILMEIAHGGSFTFFHHP